MSRFFVGQRVRILYSTGWPELAGQEGRIERASFLGPSMGEQAGMPCWLVAPDGWGTSRAPRPTPNGGTHLGAIESQLEPIQPDGAQPSEFTTLHDLLNSLEGVRA